MNCLVLVFSKDRALQLDATLRSFLLHCKGTESSQMRILYITSTPLHTEQYEQIKQKYQKSSFIKFGCERNFYSDVLALLSPSDYIIFLVDDNIFVRNFHLQLIIEMLDTHPDVLGCSLRLGKNTKYCYPFDVSQQLPHFKSLGHKLLKFNWSTEKHDFGYPLEGSSSVYRTKDILPYIAGLPFKNPNTLEALMDANKLIFKHHMPFLLCFEESVTFCAPFNIVQRQRTNRSSNFGKVFI